MSRSYKVTGINLKASPLGEQDRLLTILTAERGLVRAVAGGARKGKSSLSGRSNLFVVNQLVIAPGRSLDRITQAETLESFPRFSQDLPRLTAAQYLAEVALLQALEDHPQPDLFDLLQGHLSRLHTAPRAEILPRLTQGIFHLLTLAGLAPQVFHCCRSQQPLIPQFEDPYWRAGFSVTAGGVVALNLSGDSARRDRDRRDASLGQRGTEGEVAGEAAAVSAAQTELPQRLSPIALDSIALDSIAPDSIALNSIALDSIAITREPEVDEQVNPPDRTPVLPLTAHALHCLQSLAQADFPHPTPAALADRDPLPPPFVGFPQLRSPRVPPPFPTNFPSPLPPSDQLGKPSSTVEDGPAAQNLRLPSAPSLPPGSSAISVWLHLEGILRQYIQYHFDRPLRSAQLMDTCFSSPQPQPFDP